MTNSSCVWAVRIIFLWIILVLGLFFIECSPELRFKILSHVFDGVPERTPDSQSLPDSLTIDSLTVPDTEQITVSELVQKNIHSPFADHLCDNCHDPEQGNTLSASPSEVCYNCHDDFSVNYVVLHGPVAAGFCTACHQPHTSKNTALLNWERNKMCVHCHKLEDVLRNEVHEDISESDCAECHNSHGGEDRYLLN